MKLLEFVQKHPSRARGALYILSIGFAASFLALIVLGCAVHHNKTVERDTNASLIIGDLLALHEAKSAGRTGESAVYRALIDTRMSFCLSREDSKVLTDILADEEADLCGLCDTLRTAVAQGRCTAAVLSAAIKESASYTKQSLSDVRSNAVPLAAYLPYKFSLFDTRKQAEAFFGVNFVFRMEGNVAYCENLYSQFEDKSGRMTAFSTEWEVTDDVILANERCTELAQSFIEQRMGIQKTIVETTRFTDGVCWVDFSDIRGSRWKIGVCGNTGRVCFCCPQEKTAA